MSSRSSYEVTNRKPPVLYQHRMSHESECEGFASDASVLPALKGSNYRIVPNLLPLRSRYRAPNFQSSGAGTTPQSDSRTTNHVVRKDYLPTDTRPVGSKGSIRGKNAMPKMDVQNSYIRSSMSSSTSGTSAAIPRAGGGSNLPVCQAGSSPTKTKCPPLMQTHRDSLPLKASNQPITPLNQTTNCLPMEIRSPGKRTTPTGASTVDLSNLTAFEEEEVKVYQPNVFYCGAECKQKVPGSSGRSNNDGFDDENGHYRISLGDHIAYRYEIQAELGRGTFGVVVRAFDHKYQQKVAVKIIKAKPSYTKQAKEEVKILQLLSRDDLNEKANIVRLLDVCMFRNHYILAFELLGMDLYSLCQKVQFKPFTKPFIYQFCSQFLVALEYTRMHRIIHCDIKPENIVVSTNVDSYCGKLSPSGIVLKKLKLIDFGSACFFDRRVYSYIQSRYYRAPEIVLGIPYTQAIDMWSFGCVLCEMANGYPIFPASGEGELLERFIEYLGPVPSEILSKGKRVSKFYSDSFELRPNLSKKGRQRKKPFSRSLHHFLKGTTEMDQLFLHLVSRCLDYNPSKRITPKEALEHPWMLKMRKQS